MCKELFLFADGSVDPPNKIGFGAFLFLSSLSISLAVAKSLVKIKRFENTSSTKLELQVLLFALTEIDSNNCHIIVYTDSQNIIGLPGRRERFEKNDYRSKNGKLIANYELYQEFYRLTDSLRCEFVKVKGHKVLGQKDQVDQFFSLVDRASRNALRERG
ncbi:ribonuclease H [Labilibaculum filiforme]|uniref:Ribonuclease H n=1 Tax=Labilibaculum filiforme TaxID=1940526 RepID=A0A2N3I2B0_9BACT|nr:RNase H family protein [Labilibaculum filiforme]PKQ64441.1 ribonuclease H [Labilibaculum filiforme]